MITNKILLTFVVLLPAFLSYLGTLVMKSLALKYQIIDIPNQRSSHQEPTPRGGGMAIAATFLVLFAFSPLIINIKITDYLGVIVGGIAIAVLGFVDDLVTLRKTPRLIIWFGITIVVLAFGINLKSITFPVFGELNFGLVSPIITFIWLIGVTNFYNFMDGINGLTGSESLIVAGFLAGIGYFAGNMVVFLSAGILFGSVLGFLPHNFPKAKIFLGDGGSNFLGYIIAVLAIIGSQTTQNKVPFLIPFMLSSLFIFDAGFALLRHLPKGKDWLEPHLDHYFQRLIKLGYSHSVVTLFYSALNVILGVLAILYFQTQGLPALAIAVSSFIPFLLIVIITIQSERKILV
jgi:UDP-GlcNAc:undecaprenyl-phosphate GlcNAc-1-phosphate transferase